MKRAHLSLVVAALAVVWATPRPVTAESGSALGVRELLAQTGSILTWNPWLESGEIEGPLAKVSFKVGLRWVVLNHRTVLHLAGPISWSGAELHVPTESFATLASVLAGWPTEETPRAEVTQRVAAILIDPGHGGKDPGTNQTHLIDDEELTTVEKHIVLDVARTLRASLQDRYPEKQVLMTRTDDSYLSLEQRVSQANDAIPTEPDVTLFISIHANASPFNSDARGFEVWVLPSEYRREVIDPAELPEPELDIHPILNLMLEEEISRESVVLARDIVSSLESAVGDVSPSRGIRDEIWYVVRNARMPAVLVELGFVTNPLEAQRLADRDYLFRLAQALYSGIESFVTWFESRAGGA